MSYVGNNFGALQFNGVQAAGAGSYTLRIYYLSGVTRSAQISVNGGAATTLSFASTGGWNTVGYKDVAVSLKAGSNTLKFYNTSGWAPDFDRITVGTGSGPTLTRTKTAVSPTPTRTRTQTSTKTPNPPTTTPTRTPSITTPPQPVIGIQVSPTQVVVGQTLTVGGALANMGIPLWTLYANSQKIADARFDGVTNFYANSSIVEAISASGGQGGSSFTLRAKNPGTVQLYLTANGEVAGPGGSFYFTTVVTESVTVTVAPGTLTPTPILTSQPFMLTGVIYDSAVGPAKPIPGAAVFIRLDKHITVAGADENGRYRLWVGSAYLAATQITFGAQAEGFDVLQSVVSAADLASQPARDFALFTAAPPTPTPTRNPQVTPTATPPCANAFSGTVSDVDSRNALAGAVVKLEKHSGVSSTTNGTGAYSLVFPYYYSPLTRVSLNGYRDVLANPLSLGCGSGAVVDFQLAAGGTPPTPTPTPVMDLEAQVLRAVAQQYPGCSPNISVTGNTYILNCPVGAGHSASMSITRFASAAEAQTSFATARGTNPLQCFHGYPAYAYQHDQNPGTAMPLSTRIFSWQAERWVLKAYSFDDTSYNIAIPPLTLSESTYTAAVGQSLFPVGECEATPTPTPVGSWEFTAVTGDATSVTASGATLNASGCVNRIGTPSVEADGSLTIEYWMQADPANKQITPGRFIYGGTCQTISMQVATLASGTMYGYRACNISVCGEIRTFTTLSGPITTTPTVTPAAGATLMIDSFSNSSKWSSKLNDLNKAISWVMDSIYYGDPTPGNIVMNSSPSGQYYQETIAQSLAGRTTLTLRLRDWSDTDTEAHWNIVLNDGTDHAVALNAYGNVTGSYTDINIPLSAFGANLANTQYLRIAHKDSTYAVLMIDAISAR